jgi:hypothetical protein
MNTPRHLQVHQHSYQMVDVRKTLNDGFLWTKYAYISISSYRGRSPMIKTSHLGIIACYITQTAKISETPVIQPYYSLLRKRVKYEVPMLFSLLTITLTPRHLKCAQSTVCIRNSDASILCPVKHRLFNFLLTLHLEMVLNKIFLFFICPSSTSNQKLILW